MRSFMRSTDSVAVVGAGIALSVYKWLMQKGYACAGSRNTDLFEQAESSQLYSEDDNSKIEASTLRLVVELEALPKHVDVALVDLPLNYIANHDFQVLIHKYTICNPERKVIFFPRINLPKRVCSNKVAPFITKINNSLKTLKLTLEITKVNKNINFFPAYQLAFYLGLRSQVEAGKNKSLDFVRLAIDLFGHLYLPIEGDIETTQTSNIEFDLKESCDFLGDSHILNILEATKMLGAPRTLLMSGSEWDAQNFTHTPYRLSLTPKYSKPISKKSSIEFPSQENRVLITNIGTHSHCLHERLTEALKINKIKETDLHYFDFIQTAIKYYRAKHLKLLADIKDRYSIILVISDPPIQHFRIYEDGRKYEKLFELIDQVYERLFEDIGCTFLNSRNLIGGSGKAYDFLSSKTLSSDSDEIDWIHGNSDYYKFIWKKTENFILNSRKFLF